MAEHGVGGLTEDTAALRPAASRSESDSQFRTSLADALDNLCAMVAHVTGAQAVVVAQQDLVTNTIRVHGKVGTLVKQVDMSFVLPELNAEKAPLIVVPDVRNDARFQNHPLLRLMPHIKSLMAMLVPVPRAEGRAVLKIVNPRKSAMLDGAVMQILTDACATASGVLRMASAAAPGGQSGVREGAAGVAEDCRGRAVMSQDAIGANHGAAARFLLDTLSRKRILHSRNGSDYVSLRTWRKAIKTYQIAALNAIKAEPPEDFVETVAREIADSVRQTHGDGTIGSVVPIPPGSSGLSKSFARQVAARVAEQIGAAYADVLESQLPVKRGKSAPQKSAALRPYAPVTGLNCPILIIDDVASSGRHIELAIKAIKTPHVSVYAVAWIGKS